MCLDVVIVQPSWGCLHKVHTLPLQLLQGLGALQHQQHATSAPVQGCKRLPMVPKTESLDGLLHQQPCHVHADHPQHVLLRGVALTARKSLPSMYTSNLLVLSSSRKLTTAALQQQSA
jgi:hypothetical protein